MAGCRLNDLLGCTARPLLTPVPPALRCLSRYRISYNLGPSGSRSRILLRRRDCQFRFPLSRPTPSPLSPSQGSGGVRGFGVSRASAARYGQAAQEQKGEPLKVQDETGLPSFFSEMTTSSPQAPRILLWASGFALVILMRGAIVRELAYWVLWFGRFALYAAEALTVAFAGIMHFAAEPVAMVVTLAGWAALAATEVYHFVVDTTPVQALLNSLLLSSAVLSLRDATATTARVNGSPEQGVGIATILALAGVLELVSPETLVLSLVALSAFLLLVRKADPVTVFMPATVTFVAISEPILQAVAFALFVILIVHANWKSTLPQPTQLGSRPSQSRLSVVLVAVTSAILISVVTRALYARSITWLLVR